MSDPYKVLGLTSSATESEIKTAYKKLSRKYHPDLNPNDKLAEEKFKEINSAYKSIMDSRKNGFNSFSGYNSNDYSSEDDTYIQAAMNFISNQRFNEAINVLNNVKVKNAKWYYVSSIANIGLGNRDLAKEYAYKAYQMEPNNIEYKRLYDSLVNGFNNNYYSTYSNYNQNSDWYRKRQNEYGYNSDSYSDFCTRMCCYNLICNCCCTPFCR